MPAVLPYHEPTLIHLLVFSSFLYLLNIIRVAADFLIHGGIVAEITLGIIFGSPLAGLLHIDWEATFTVLGYIGLVLVVFEGGLSSNLRMLLSNLPLSLVCAATGIIFPIALSFASLYAGFGYRPLEAFAAGAALSSDSLGTTLAALNSATKASSSSSSSSSPTSPPKGRTLTVDSERTTCALPLTRTLTPAHRADTSATLSPAPNSLKQSRIGTVLISAAIIDDVIGLVVAAVMPALALVQHDTAAVGGSSIAWPVVRPLLASVLMAVIAPVASRFVLRPAFWWSGCGERWCAPARPGKPWGFERLTESGWGSEMHADAAKLFLMVALLSAMAAISHYTGTSVLFGSYLGGLMLTYISQPPAPAGLSDADGPHTNLGSEHRANSLSFEETFTRLLGPVQEYVLLPLFFASIGFAIPFLDLWRPAMIWRGIVYSVLMCFAKLAVGVPILLYGPYLHYSPAVYASVRRRGASLFSPLWRRSGRAEHSPPRDVERLPRSSTLTSREPALHEKTAAQNDIRAAPSLPANPEDVAEIPSEYRASTSVPAAAFMGAAMVARGEIGLLIAQLARGGSEHAPGGGVPGVLSEEPFLLCIWAIFLCTLVGPVALGYFVRRWGPRLNSGIWA